MKYLIKTAEAAGDAGTAPLPQTGDSYIGYMLAGGFLLVLGVAILYYYIAKRREAIEA